MIYSKIPTATNSHQQPPTGTVLVGIQIREKPTIYNIISIITIHFSFLSLILSTSYTAAPMDIPLTSGSSLSCAYPSWPRRLSLSSNSSTEERATSLIPDDDLEDNFSSVLNDEEIQAQVTVDIGVLMKKSIAQEKAKKRKRRWSIS